MTDKETKAFYNSSAWKQKRLQILERDHYECQDCRRRLKDAVAAGHILQGEDRKIRRAEEVHHIVELKEHPELGLEDDNLISLCVKCHNLRHGRTPRRFQRKKKLAKKDGSYTEGRHSLGGDKRTVQAVACAVRVRSCPQFLNSPPVNSRRFFLSEERGCSQDSGKILKSRVKRVRG